jgi:L-ascorbate metabolism protein UlaG (beta-lactamase superfamily)
MSFEDLLRKKLGPMRDLVSRAARPDPPVYDPAKLYYRRAVGLEARIRPEETWSQAEIGRIDAPGRALVRLEMEEAAHVMGMTSWKSADSLGVRPATLWKLVEQDLLFFSTDDPGVNLSGRSGVLASGGRIAWRRSMWPTAAIETATSVSPMPFMPRTADLVGAEMTGVRFAGLERGFEVVGVTITGSKKTGALLARLIPLLDGRKTASEIVQAFQGDEIKSAQKMLELLDQMTILDRGDAIEHMTSPTDPRVTWLGHAGVLVQASGKSILIDPLFFSASDPKEKHLDAPKLDPRALPAIDAVFITHGDNDHLNASSLLMLPRDTPIYVPRVGDRVEAHQVDMPRFLSVLGFRAVRELDEYRVVAIGDVEVTACPFLGESWGLALAKLTYRIDAPNLALYVAADSLNTQEVMRQIAALGPRIDLAFMGVSGSAETFVMPEGFGYGNFYREWIPRVRYNEWVKHCAGPEDAVRMLSALEPRFAFGYAAGGASYIRTEYSDTGNHEQLAELLERERTDTSTRAIALRLGEPTRIPIEYAK